jgi:hypothetical protein
MLSYCIGVVAVIILFFQTKQTYDDKSLSSCVIMINVGIEMNHIHRIKVGRGLKALNIIVKSTNLFLSLKIIEAA